MLTHAIHSTSFGDGIDKGVAIIQVDRKSDIGDGKSRSLGIPVCDNRKETRFPCGPDRGHVVATATEDENSLGTHRTESD